MLMAITGAGVINKSYDGKYSYITENNIKIHKTQIQIIFSNEQLFTSSSVYNTRVYYILRNESAYS